MFNAVEGLNKLVLASACIFSRLEGLGVKIGTRERFGCRIPTERRTPIPVKTTAAGGNA